MYKIKLVIKLSIVWIKSYNDNKNFRLAKGFGFDVYEIENMEDVDKKIKDLVNKKYSTIVVSKELAAFSQDIITKYKKTDNVNIIISHK